MITPFISGIIGFFIVFHCIKKPLKKIVKRDLCVLCASVATTWILALIAMLGGWGGDRLAVGILMGESVAGIMYALQRQGKKQQLITNGLNALATLIIGTTLAYSLITQTGEWGAGVISGILLLISGTKRRISKSNAPWSKRLQKQLEQCCG